MEQALSDIKVLDLTHHVAGPHCTGLLASFGAEVIKVERPGQGDPTRQMGPFPQDIPHPEKSGLFLYLNNNKKSITLNLKHPGGVRILEELVRQSDILVESFSPRVMPGLGLSYEKLETINPKLIMTSISSFGQTGPYRDYKATNMILDAIVGSLYLKGLPDRAPVQVGFSIAEYFGGVCGFLATLIALYARNKAGTGQYLDVSIMEAYLHSTETKISLYWLQGLIPNRNFPPAWYGGFARCNNGYLKARPAPGRREELASFMGLSELEDPRFATEGGRNEHAVEIDAIMASWFQRQEKVDLFKRAQEWRMPFGYVATTKDILNDEQFQSRGYFIETEHPEVGKVIRPGAPFIMSETPWQMERPAPLLGEHNEEILCGRLGFSREDLTRLRQAGTI